MKYNNALRIAGTVAAVTAAGALVVGGTAASAGTSKGIPDATIKMKGNAHPRFDAPETVTAGDDLQILNRSNPQVIGPHTFSLVEKSELPRTNDELKRCAKFRGICRKIGTAHGVAPPDFLVTEPDVENGAEGWDARFDGGDPGDTWYSETQDEATSRQVTADAGNLWFMCAVHPDMQGKVKVLNAR